MGAFAEILNTFNKLIESQKISKDKKNSLLKDEIIYSLFIAIIYARPSRNVIEMYMKIFEIETKWNVEFSMDYLFYRCSKLKEVDLSNLNTSHVTTMTGFFSSCSSASSTSTMHCIIFFTNWRDSRPCAVSSWLYFALLYLLWMMTSMNSY